ncbi:alanine dehydrogenase [Sulfuricella sp. T08]|uniref:alanine dehydrogenase n=1 Tax=Sulfuricella sp. T08 TaxID=1632857 RepID=UPI0006179D7F|nr:alanine dehydrogenase [Sulfuricella sp. T08]GAO37633.1 alanine dehydrogenase [Sulfuricella sp. T08]
MLIGVPREIKDHEYRVGITPAGVRALTDAGHEVWVETRAGERIGFSDALYLAAGARIANTASDAYACPLIVKVKEPQPSEIPLLRKEQVLFTYLHLAADPALTRRLLESRIIAIAYETVTDAAGALPLLTPMSEVAGRIAIQAGATALQLANGGRGVLLGGVPGVAPGKVLILGAGTVGTHAARMALGLGADVTLMDISLPRLRHLDDIFGARLKTRYSEAHAIEELAYEADLIVGSVLLPGKRAPKLISRALIQRMKPASVLVDVAIDQGGCAETSRPTTHSSPTYIEEGVVHYCVANMPAACARTATQALTNATLPYVLAIAGKGWRDALKADAGLRKGLNLHLGQVTHAGLAADLEFPCISPDIALE